LLSGLSSDLISPKEAGMKRQALMGVAAAALVLSAGTAAAGPPDGNGQHRVRGEVVSIDEARGSLTLKTGEGSAVALHLPPGSLKGFRKGDRLTLELAVDRAGKAAGAPGSRRPSTPAKAD
jgi:hypothetical protein